MNFPKRSFFILILLTGLLSALPLEAKKKPGSSPLPPTELYQELDLFSKVMNLVREDYVEKVEDKTILYGAIRGMLATLDPHSVFLPPDVYQELKVDTEGRFGGVGLEVTVKDNFLTVVTPIEGTPAAKANLREGDRILKIDGIPAKEIGLTEAVRKMRGARGTRMALTIYRPETKENFEVPLVRDTIRIQSVRAEMLEEGFGYARVSSFQENTSEELQRALDSLEKKSKLKGLILDLRNNPGGLLDEAVNMSDMFLETGIIVTTAGRNQAPDKKLASRSGHEPTYPIIVLVNGGSASAAEIVAGALQDHKRAVLLGTQTFGKGSVQTIFEIGEGGALKLTVAKYYTPSGRSIQLKGIRPDIIVEARKSSKEDDQKKSAIDYLRKKID